MSEPRFAALALALEQEMAELTWENGMRRLIESFETVYANSLGELRAFASWLQRLAEQA